MKSALLAAAILSVTVATAHADKFIMSAEKAYAVGQGLTQLGTYDKVVKDGAQEKVVKAPSELGPGMRILIARDIAAITNFMETTRTAGKAAEAQTTDEKKAKTALADIFAAPQEIELQPVDLDELDLAKNPIPAATLALIMPIVAKK